MQRSIGKLRSSTAITNRERKDRQIMNKEKKKNLQIIRISEGEIKGGGWKDQVVGVIIVENYSTLWKKVDVQLQGQKNIK